MISKEYLLEYFESGGQTIVTVGNTRVEKDITPFVEVIEPKKLDAPTS